MSEPKPLTKERRAEIETYAAESSVVADLLAAERFWREAVKNASEFPSDECASCGTRNYGSDRKHKPDCAWLLAQD